MQYTIVLIGYQWFCLLIMYLDSFADNGITAKAFKMSTVDEIYPKLTFGGKKLLAKLIESHCE